MSTQPSTLDLRAVNAMERSEFTAALGDIFEHSPWVAEAAWAERPFASVAALHAAMMAAVRASGRSRKIEFLRGHPPLSGTAVRAGTMTTDSIAEQKSAGLEALSASEEESLARQNRDYQARHGIPFIVCVRHYTRAGIFAELASRSAREPSEELAEAMRQIGFITGLRLVARVNA
jgi:2-oxo-4-hydroxy-4-carboxy-5-ureidoimidazoline decarboxylase